MIRQIPVKIERVLELQGASLRARYDIHNLLPTIICAHVSKPVTVEGREIRYALLTQASPQQNMMELGNIDPETNIFEYLDPNRVEFSTYRRAPNGVIIEANVPSSQVSSLKSLDEVLAITGISVTRESVPK